MKRLVFRLLSILVLVAVPVGASGAEPAALSLADARKLAETHNSGLQLTRLQMSNARRNLATAPANAVALAPAASLFAQIQLGIAIPTNAISADAARRQAQISYEQAVAQYYDVRQQVRLGVIQAYVEWQRSMALVAAQRGALDRALTQEQHVQAALAAGSVARYDLLLAQAQVASQNAALAAARALQQGALNSLEQVVGRALVPGIQPGDPLLRAADVTLEEDLMRLTARGLARRPDLRQAALTVAARRLQASLATGNTEAAVLQWQAAAVEYELRSTRAVAEIRQAYLGVESARAELLAREAAADPARESLRLAELRYESGIGTYLEVQAASAALDMVEAARIQAAANLAVSIARLKMAAGEL